MKKLFCVSLLYIVMPTFAQVNVTVNVATSIKTLNGKELGINMNYLMDDAIITPAPSTTTTTALQQMGIKLLRYPGGEKSDNYLFSATPWTSSSPRMALKDAFCYWPTGDATFVNLTDPEKTCLPGVLDFDEFMTMCNSIGAEPLIVVAYDAIYNTTSCAKPTKIQLITHAAEWVRYANIVKGYNVKYWMIGNESWNSPTYNGQTTPAQYAVDINDFAIAMRAVDPSIKIVANGKSGWWRTLLESAAAPNIDYLGYSEYPTYNYTGGYSYYQTNNVNLTPETNAAINDINNFATATDKARIKVIPTEFNSIDFAGMWTNENNLGHALANFQIFGDLILKPKVETACMWNTRWINNVNSPQEIYDAIDQNGNMNANGIAQQVWSKILLNNLVSTTSSSNVIRVFASYNNIQKKLNIALLNKETNTRTINLSINNFTANYAGSRWEFKGTSISDKFPTYSQTAFIGGPSDISSVILPANSVTVIQLQDISVLPTKLLSFKGSRHNGKNMLEWKVTNEDIITQYEVERSQDGIHFITTASIKAKTSGGTSVYNFTDEQTNPTEMAFYRIKLVEAGTVSSYSAVVKINAPGIEDFQVKISPNPAAGDVVLQTFTSNISSISVRILQMNGQVLWSKKLTVSGGLQKHTLVGTASIQPGIYNVEVVDEANNTVLRMIKQ